MPTVSNIYRNLVTDRVSQIYNNADTISENELDQDMDMIRIFLYLMVTNKKREKAVENKTIVKVISKAVFNSRCDDECAICVERHPMGECVKTSCNHTFGKECLGRWLMITNNCPSCRHPYPQVTSYRVRKSPTKKVAEIIEID